MNIVSLSYPLVGSSIPADMGYAMYGALSAVCDAVHGMEGLQIATVPAGRNTDGVSSLGRHARLEVRVPEAQVPTMLALAGRQLRLNQRTSHAITLGIPDVRTLAQIAGGTDRLYVRHVALKIRDRQTSRLLTDADDGFWPRWSRRLQMQLEARGIEPTAALVDVDDLGQPFSRRVRAGSGYVTTVGITLTGLTPEAVQTLLSQGLGGKQRLGCGVAVVPSRVFAG